MNKKTTKPAAKAATKTAPATQPKEPAIPKGAPKDKSFSQLVAGVMLSPAFNGANVVQSFGKGLINDEAKFFDIADELKSTFKDVKAGNLSGMEQMLVAQATALQSMFTAMALRAQAQTQMPHLEKFMGLALKAQAQSRATIQALVELKYPTGGLCEAAQHHHWGAADQQRHPADHTHGRKADRPERSKSPGGSTRWQHVPGRRSSDGARPRRSSCGSRGGKARDHGLRPARHGLRAMPTRTVPGGRSRQS